jgi:phage host-nuclease inhibitor protein Gam
VPIDPATGEQDVQWMIHEGTKNMMRAELEMDKAKVDVRKEAAKELKNIDLMDDAQKAVFKETKDIIINNAEAFPSKVAMLQEKYGKNGKPAPESSLKSKYAEEYAAAKDWDSNKFEKEVDVAMDMTLEEYVGKIKDAPPEIQERRKRVWEYANQNKPKEAVTETAPKQTAAPQTAPAAPTVKQVTLPDGRQGILVPVEGGKPRFFLKNPEQ